MEIFFLAGFAGGAIRGIVGILKYALSYKDIKINWGYFGGLTLISGLIGMAAAGVIRDMGVTFEGIVGLSPAIALVVGYAGGDFLENIFKVLMKKPILFGGEK
jgi:hypothetical protein